MNIVGTCYIAGISDVARVGEAITNNNDSSRSVTTNHTTEAYIAVAMTVECDVAAIRALLQNSVVGINLVLAEDTTRTNISCVGK